MSKKRKKNPKSTQVQVNEATMRAGRVARGQSGTLLVGFTESASWHGVVPDSFRQFRASQPDAELQQAVEDSKPQWSNP